jgi:hypothetical protein
MAFPGRWRTRHSFRARARRGEIVFAEVKRSQMKDLVDDRFGVSFQFGIHGAALLRFGGFLQNLVFNRDDQINRSPQSLEPIERFWASRTFAEGLHSCCSVGR